MNDGGDPGRPPQDTGGPDAVEHWSAADRYGTTPFEQRHGEDLEHRLREEVPDSTPEDPAESSAEPSTAAPPDEE